MKLGLVGQHIGQSRSRAFQQFLGGLKQQTLEYALIDRDLRDQQAFDRLMRDLVEAEYRGINVTHPYKVYAWQYATDRAVDYSGLGALNTLCFDGSEVRGTNTDYTGFIKAFRDQVPYQSPGRVLVQGTGGVGRAICFALGSMRASHLELYDRDQASADSLCRDLAAAGVSVSIVNADELNDCMTRVDGLVNATPVGHHMTPGTVFPQAQLGPQKWATDAVYTPVMTEFMTDAQSAGLKIMTGLELYLFQAIDAFEFFTGLTVDPEEARQGV